MTPDSLFRRFGRAPDETGPFIPESASDFKRLPETQERKNLILARPLEVRIPDPLIRCSVTLLDKKSDGSLFLLYVALLRKTEEVALFGKKEVSASIFFLCDFHLPGSLNAFISACAHGRNAVADVKCETLAGGCRCGMKRCHAAEKECRQ